MAVLAPAIAHGGARVVYIVRREYMCLHEWSLRGADASPINDTSPSLITILVLHSRFFESVIPPCSTMYLLSLSSLGTPYDNLDRALTLALDAFVIIFYLCQIQ